MLEHSYMWVTDVYLLRSRMQKLQGPNSFYCEECWFQCGGVLGKRWRWFGQKQEQFWTSVGMVLGAICIGKSMGLGS